MIYIFKNIYFTNKYIQGQLNLGILLYMIIILIIFQIFMVYNVYSRVTSYLIASISSRVMSYVRFGSYFYFIFLTNFIKLTKTDDKKFIKFWNHVV